MNNYKTLKSNRHQIEVDLRTLPHLSSKQNYLRIHWRLLTILKTSKKVYEVMYFDTQKVYIFWKFVHYTIHWHETQMLKAFPLDKINGTKNAFFFLSRTPADHRFTFNLWFLYGLKYKVCLSKNVRFRFVFIKVSIFFSIKNRTLWL